jgi:microcompartment protein PduB
MLIMEMDKDQIIQKVMSELQKQNETQAAPAGCIDVKKCGMTEFVGTAAGDTIGLVIPNVDETLQGRLEIDKKYRSLGIVGSRTGAGPHAVAADEAVKASNAELLKLELPRDCKGGPGHGVYLIFGAEEVSDARRAVEITLKSLETTFGEIFVNDAGHLEAQYTARASHVLNKFFNAPLGRAWGFVGVSPAAIGVVASDAMLKSANVEVVLHASPAYFTSHSNEFMLFITGDSGAVKQAVIRGKEVALKLLGAMGEPPTPCGKPYLY